MSGHLWRAVRSRLGQSVVLAALSALTTACLVSAPLLARAMEQGLLRSALLQADPAATALTVSALVAPRDARLTPDDLAASVPPAARPFFPTRLGSYQLRTSVPTRVGALPSPVRLSAREDVCGHVRLVRGRCPEADGEAMVSSADATAWGWGPGTTLSLSALESAGVGQPSAPTDARATLAVVGVYEAAADPSYWLGLRPDGVSGLPIAIGTNLVPGVDDLITAPLTFAHGWSEQVEVAARYPLDRSRFTLDSLAVAQAALADVPASATIAVDTPVARIVASIRSGQDRVRFLVPVIAAQLALLAAAVLVVVAQAAVEQRRPEVALARLRGHSRASAGRLLMTELGAVVLCGLPAGMAFALLASLLVRAWLPAGIPFELPLLSVAALGLAGVVGLAAVYAAARPVLREPVTALLRGVPPTTGAARLGVVDAVLVVLALVGAAGLATRTVSGPVAILTPVLLALAAGGVGAALLSTLWGRWGRRRLGRAPLAATLAALAAARRPGLRWTLIAVSMATAMVVFAADAAVVADRNRADRARLESGAPAVLFTDSTSPAAVVKASDGLGPLSAHVAPVAVIRPADTSSTATLAMRPADLRTVAFAPPVQGAVDTSALAPPPVETVLLAGRTLTGTVRWAPTSAAPASAPLLGHLGLTVTTAEGAQLSRDLASLPVSVARTIDIRAPLLCPDRCRLNGLWFRAEGDPDLSVSGTLTIAGLSLDGAPLRLGDGASWQSTTDPAGGRLAVTSTSATGDLSADVANTGARSTALYGDVPARLPVVLSGQPPPGVVGPDFQIQSLGGTPIDVQAVQRVAALPQVGASGALANLDVLLRLGGSIPPTGALEVWVDTEDPATLAAVREGLRRAGVIVVSTRTYAARKASYDESASGWGLAIELVAGVLALLIGALVMVVVALTGWRRSAQDLAALRLAGVRPRLLARAVRLEHSAVAVSGAVVGALCGLVGAVVALPLLPLFDLGPPVVPAADLTQPWAVLGLVSVGAAVLFVGAALVLARWLLARAAGERIGESG